jgi:hypothetical protein
MVCLNVIVNNEDALAHWGLLRHEKKTPALSCGVAAGIPVRGLKSRLIPTGNKYGYRVIPGGKAAEARY